LAAAQSAPTIGELFASENTAKGPVLLAGSGMTVSSGSQVAAGKSVATLRLARGGEVRICPETGLTLSSTSEHQELMLAIGSGAVELDYPVNDLADTLITPDFKIMLAGPGVFHFSLGVNNRGDTCIEPLWGNSSSIIVSEMAGSAVYQVKQDEAVLFEGGKLNGHSPLNSPCGCPRPIPTIRADETHTDSVKPGTDVSAGLPAERPGAVHVQVEAPLVFHGDQPVQSPYAVAKVSFSSLPNLLLPQERVEPTDLKEMGTKQKQKKGFFGRAKGFFASLFHR
jgi:hypothetical protein